MQQSSDRAERDFSYWMDLALNDPEQFESKRTEAIYQVIQRAPAETRIRLERLQWRVDRMRERSSSPMAATLELSRMMWDSFHALRDHYQEILHNTPSAGSSASSSIGAQTKTQHPTVPVRNAEIIPFPQPAKVKV